MKKNYRRILKLVSQYMIFFAFIAFIITCCMVLFLEVQMDALNIKYSSENVEKAAKLTFLNVLFLSFIITVIDVIRRKITVSRHVTKIVEGANKMVKGDFSVRIAPKKTIDEDDEFNKIISCFNKMAQELSGIETLRCDFIANVSHELKTPLSVIQNYAIMLEADNITQKEVKEYAKTIKNASKGLAELITNMLKLNKLENQNIYPNNERYNLSEHICECMILFENAWEEKHLNIETDIDEDVYVYGDKEMMSLVWNNLISNAIKFTDDYGTISLKVKEKDNNVYVMVADTGCGMTKDVGEHIFDKFYQGDTSHATKGNGLGLALVKRIIDITKSDISIKSTFGAGSEFTVKIGRNDIYGKDEKTV